MELMMMHELAEQETVLATSVTFAEQFVSIEPCAKERPRWAFNRMHNSKHYEDWKVRFAALVKPFPMVMEKDIGIDVIFLTKTGHMKPDIDNAIGAIYDSLQQANYLVNDSNVRHGKHDVFPCDTPGIYFRIYKQQHHIIPDMVLQIMQKDDEIKKKCKELL